MTKLSEMLVENPVIAAIRNDEDLEKVIKTSVQIVFVLYGSILNISDICRKLNAAHKTVFIHLDLIEGLKCDCAGMEFIKENANPVGIITTKVNIIKHSRQYNLQAILRVFILDSLSLKTGIKNINETNPDATEVLPGVACKIIHGMQKQTSVPVIAGGLITQKKDIIDAISAGAIAISTTARDLWEM